MNTTYSVDKLQTYEWYYAEYIIIYWKIGIVSSTMVIIGSLQ